MEESVEVFPNQAVYPSNKCLPSFEDCYPITTEPSDVCPSPKSKRKFQAPADVSNTHRRNLSDPISSVRYEHATHSNRAMATDAPGILQSKIQSMPPVSAMENASKCNICQYRCSIEKWDFPDGLIFCPNCLSVEAPILRTKTKKAKTFLRSSLCLNFILYCWPLCSLPFGTLPPRQNYLHCPQCFTFLGMYDERRRCIQPSRKFVEYNGCFSAEQSRRQAKQQEQQRWKDDMFKSQAY